MKFLRALSVLTWLGLGTAVVGQTYLIDQTDLMPSELPGQLIVPGISASSHPAPTAAVDRQSNLAGAQLLNSLVSRGLARGFVGLAYENRDRGHSTVSRDTFGGLTFVKYGPVLRKSNLDYGLAGRVVIPSPVIGNSSTARIAPGTSRSLSRLAMTSPRGPVYSFSEYTANSLYIYPEHRDHDDRDMYPANWPYSINSQGSSGSDRKFLNALLMTAAAFSAETRQVLEDNGLFASTLQMIMRRNLKDVNSNADYMSAVAHPSAFDGEALRPGRMISHAASIAPGDLPPMVRLNVAGEDFGPRAGLMQMNERLFSTPSAIARIWRDYHWQREIVVSAEGTADPNGRELKFYWAILRGNPQKISIEPLNENGSRARITLMWHDDYSAPPLARGEAGPRLTSRVDIGVFANNGAGLSAPAFISVSFPTHQLRTYGRTEDGDIRLKSIDFRASARSAVYDPLLFWEADWRDQFKYHPDGMLAGWTRTTPSQEFLFAPDGRLTDGRQVEYKLPEKVQTEMSVTFSVADN